MIAVEFGNWTVQSAPFIIVEHPKLNIIGRNILPKTAIALVQEKPKQNQNPKYTRNQKFGQGIETMAKKKLQI